MEEIIIRNGPAGPRAGLIGGMDVWEYVMIARSYDWDIGAALDDFPHESHERFAAALAHYRADPTEVDARLREMDNRASL